MFSVAVSLFLLPGALAGVGKGGVGRLPALGWNSWNAFHCEIDATRFIDAAKKLVALGLRDVGYIYVNIDDCWSLKERNSSGYIVADPQKFPKGIDGLSKEAQGLGLRLGIYSDAGTKTCAGYPGSLGHEMEDAKLWASWEIDYLKYDNCNVPDEWLDFAPGGKPCEFCPQHPCPDNKHPDCPKEMEWRKSNTVKRYNAMRDAINAQNRPMLYSLCNWGHANVQIWANETGQSWRHSGDIEDNWKSVMDLLALNAMDLNHTDFGGHSDADMLEVGNGGLTEPQERTHFALWAAMKSPLLIGTDLNKIKPSSLAILKSRQLIEFNQDPVYGKPAKPFKWDGVYKKYVPPTYWSGRFRDGVMVFLLNNSPDVGTMKFDYADSPDLSAGSPSKPYHISDAWTGRSYGCFRTGLEVSGIRANDTAVLVLRAGCARGPPQSPEAGKITVDYSPTFDKALWESTVGPQIKLSHSR